MSGFDYSAGRSNSMVAAEDRGMITVGRWGKSHCVSAAAVVAVMEPTEAHHTGTGRVGKSRLTPVLPEGLEPTEEQLEAMKEHDRAAKAAREAPPLQVKQCSVRWITWPTTRRARRIPTEHIEHGLTALFSAAGRISCTKINGITTHGWHKLSGLLLLGPTGEVLANRLNPLYDDLAELTARLMGGAA